VSMDYDLICVDCKVKIWIAQSGLSGQSFYSDEKGCMEELKAFLFNHIGHNLMFLSEFEDTDNYNEIKW